DPLHKSLSPIGDVGQQEILLRRETDAGVHCLDDAAHGAPQPATVAVPQAAILDEQTEKRAPVVLRVPAEMILDARDLHRCGGREGTPEVTLDFAAKPVEALRIDQVLQARVAPVAP